MVEPPSPKNAPPDLGARYRAVRLIARGGMGVVWEAHDLERDRPCAVKLLGPGPAPPEVARRFEREAVVADRLAGHEGIVAAHAAGVTPGGQPFLVMELVRGETLEDLIDAGRLSREEAVRVVRDVARAVAFAHSRGVVHRDLKPSNVLVDDAGRARLLDYGIAKVEEALGPALTATGDRLGSPCYMAPEQIEDSKRADARSDVYGLGALLYQALVREPPYDGQTVLEILRKVVDGRLVAPREKDPTVDPALDALVVRALARDPAARFSSAEELAQALDAWLAARADPRVGQVVAGKYELLERLGAGGMGAVYRARQRLDGREVALKLVHEDLLREPAARARFLREVAAAQSFVHKHAVVVRDYGEDPALGLYLTMDLARGQTLGARARSRGGRLPPAEVLALGRQVLDALAEAHAAGIVHRDLKPDNIMVDDAPGGVQARVLDFGIARAVHGEAGPADATETGRVVGTLRYMSPEQAAGEAVDARSDLWSLAAVLYEALAGRPPHGAASGQQLLWALATRDPEPLERAAPDVPGPVARAGMLPLRRDRAQRPPDAATWRRELEQAERALAAIPSRPGSARLRPAPSLAPGAATGAGTTRPSSRAPLDVLLAGPAPAAPARASSPGAAPVVVGALVLLAAALLVAALVWPRSGADATSDRPVEPTTSVAAPVVVRFEALEPQAGAVIAASEVVVRGRVAPPRGQVTVNGASAPVQGDGSFSLRVPLAPGDNALEVTAGGEGLLSTTRLVSVVHDPHAPALTVRAPEEGLETELPVTSVSAVVSDLTLERVLVNGAPVTPSLRDGVAHVDTTVRLEVGTTVIEVVAHDRAGHATTVRRTVRRLEPADEVGPPLPPGFVPGPEPRTAINEKDGSVLVWVPAATFRMGAPVEGERDARPRHEVRLSRGVWIGRTEVTWAQYRRFCQATGRTPPSSTFSPDGRTRFEAGPDHPVFNVTWSDARDYAAWAGLRLPTEAEWEYAAGAGRGARYPWGDRAPVFGERMANTGLQLDLGLPGAEDGAPFTAPVGSYPDGASPFGLLDMVGNVDEWVEDWFGLYEARPVTDPRGPSRGTRRVYRGGSWATSMRECAVWARASANPEYANAHLGFRVAR